MAKASENEYPKVTFAESAAPSTPSTGLANIYVKTDGKLYLKDDAGTETDLTASGGGTVPQWVEYLAERQTGETSHSDDDFFDDATKTGITETTASGTCTWTEKYDILSGAADAQGNYDWAVALKSLTPSSAPVTIETCMSVGMSSGNYGACGLVFTDGTATSSTMGGVLFVNNGSLAVTIGGLTVTNSDWAAHKNLNARAGGLMYLRLIWVSSNTFRWAFSPDGVSWTDFDDADQSWTMTPTHFGPAISTYGQSDTHVVGYHYLRVYESDLSV